MRNMLVKGGKYNYTHRDWFGINFLASAKIEGNREKITSFRMFIGGVL